MLVRETKKKKNKSKNRAPLQRYDDVETHDNCGDIPFIPKMWSGPVIGNQIYRIKKIVDSADVSQQSNAFTASTYRFFLGDIDSTTDLTNAFDLYRIQMVRLIFRPRFKNLTLGIATAALGPNFYSAIDYDDNTAAANIGALRQYSTLKETRWDEDHVRMFKPRYLDDAVSGVAITFVNQWIDTVNSAHYYGLKTGIIGAAAGNTTMLQTWSVQFEYYMEFKVVR